MTRRVNRLIRSLQSALICGVLLLLTGCGFALRGSDALPESLQRFYIEAPVDLARELEVLLAGNARQITGDATTADAVVKAGAERFQRRVLSVNPETGKEREVELAYGVDVSVTNAAGETLLSSQRLRLVRDFVFDSDEIIGKSREQTVLREEMRKDAAQQIVWRLSAVGEE